MTLERIENPLKPQFPWQWWKSQEKSISSIKLDNNCGGIGECRIS